MGPLEASIDAAAATATPVACCCGGIFVLFFSLSLSLFLSLLSLYELCVTASERVLVRVLARARKRIDGERGLFRFQKAK